MVESAASSQVPTPAPTPPPASAPVAKSSPVEWFWRSAQLARARQGVQDVPVSVRAQLGRAEQALELAERAFDPVDPLRSGSSLALSLSLCREAAYWALAAQTPAAPPSSLADAFANTPEDTLLFAAGGKDGLAQVESALVVKTFRETAEDQQDVQKSDARAALVFVRALIDRKLGPERRVGRLIVQRWVRTGGTALVLVIGSIVLAVLTLTKSPNLAEGKPWKASSTADGTWKAEHGEYFVHTQEEDNPWVQFDLKKSKQFSVVEVTNRTDCCFDRAVPAVIEVSQDGNKWREVARQTESYSFWEARFAPVTARYVRVRIPRRTMLHLASVAVRAS